MAAPAHHQVRVGRAQDARIAQQSEHRVGDARGGVQVVLAIRPQLDGGVGQVANHREQQFGHAPDDLAVDEGHRRRIEQIDADAAVLLQHLDVEIRVQVAGGARVVRRAAAGQDGQRAAAQQVVHAARRSVAQAGHFGPGQHIQRPAGVDLRVLYRQRPRWRFTHMFVSRRFFVS